MLHLKEPVVVYAMTGSARNGGCLMPTRRALMLRWDRLVASARPTDRTLEPRSHPWRLNAALLGVGLSGLWLADQVASSARDQSAWWVILLVVGVAGFALSALGVALYLIITESQSRAYRVFCSRHALASTVFSVVLGLVLAVPAIRRDPFHHVLSTGLITGATIVDFVFVLGVAACVIGAIAGVFGSVDAIREERSWGDSLGISHPDVSRPGELPRG